jgi:two-component system phosphate regulon response regulator PhoB
LRSILYRFQTARELTDALGRRHWEIALPKGQTVAEGEWVLAVFEVDGLGGATAAAHGVESGGQMRLALEKHDWERLEAFGRSGVLPSEEDVRDTVRPAALEDARAQRHVLMIDDEESSREVVAAMLESVGLAVHAVESAETAIEAMYAERPDLIVLDWNLPGMSGLELVRHLRRDPALSDLPVLFLTGRAELGDLVEAFASGADDYVVKPFRAPELGARIFALLRRARRGASA